MIGLIGTIIWGIVWGTVTNKVLRNKGYEENWFWWGFFFAFIPLIIACTKPPKYNYSTQNSMDTNVHNTAPVQVKPSYSTVVQNRSKKIPEKIDINSLVNIKEYEILRGSDESVLLKIHMKNVGSHAISALKIQVSGNNAFKEPVTFDGKSYFEVLLQDLHFNTGSEITHQLELKENQKDVRYFEFWVSQICCSNGEIIKCDQPSYIQTCQEVVDLKYLSYIQKTLKDANYYMIEYPKGWQCICGNVNIGEKCLNCNLKHENVMKFRKDSIEQSFVEYQKLQEEEELKRRKAEEERKKREAEEAERARLEKEAREEEEKRKKEKTKKIVIILSIVVAAALLVAVIAKKVIIPSMKYSNAVEMIENGNYEEAYTVLKELGDYKDSSEQILAGKYKQALDFVGNGEYDSAYEIFEELGDYSDVSEQIIIAKYKQASACFDKQDYLNAIELYTEISEYEDSDERLTESYYRYAKDLFESGHYKAAAQQAEQCLEYEDSDNIYKESCYKYAEECVKKARYQEAVEYYEEIVGYSDSNEKRFNAMYLYVSNHLSSEDYYSEKYLHTLLYNDYKGAKELEKKLYELRVSIVVNRNMDDFSTDATSLSRRDTWYFHVKIVNGEEGKKYLLTYKFVDPSGKHQTMVSKPIEVGEYGGMYTGYGMNAKNGKAGIATLKVYDDSGKYLGEKSVQINP